MGPAERYYSYLLRSSPSTTVGGAKLGRHGFYGDIQSARGYEPAYPDQNIWTETRFDANGNTIATIDTDGIITRTYYDELNRPETVIQNLVGPQIDDPSAPQRTTDPEHNLRTDLYYDANGNQIATQDPKGVVTRTFYDSLNRPTMVVQNWTRGNVYTVPAPDRSQGQCGSEVNLCAETFYDVAGNVSLTVDPRGVATHTDYDEANRPQTVVQNFVGTGAYDPAYPNQNIRTEITYDDKGRKGTTTDPLGHVTKYIYNDAGQLVKVTANQDEGKSQTDYNIVTEYDYDALGRQVKVTDALERVTLTAYDDLGHVLKVTRNYLDGQPLQNFEVSGDRFNVITTYFYDASGNQIAVKRYIKCGHPHLL